MNSKQADIINKIQTHLDAVDYNDIGALEETCLVIDNWIQKTHFVKGYCRT